MMLANVSRSRSAQMGACALVVMVLGGCSRVKPEELSAELAKLRAEMRSEYQQGDQQVSSTLGSRMDGFDARLTELAQRAGMRKQAMATLVKQCEAWGMVMREGDAHDARARRVCFTPTGLAWLAAYQESVAQAEAELRHAVGEEVATVVALGLEAYAAAA